MALPANSPLQLNPAPFMRRKTDATSTVMGGGYLATSPTNMGAGFVASPGIGGFVAPNPQPGPAPQNSAPQNSSPPGPCAPYDFPCLLAQAKQGTNDAIKTAALYALAVALILLGVWTLVK